jgi:Transposase domain (DUF772)
VPDDHLVRAIAAVLNLSWVHAEFVPHYSSLGRPSIDPVLMIRMLIVGYVFAIRSEVNVNLAYRWFCGLSIEGKRGWVHDPVVLKRPSSRRGRSDQDLVDRQSAADKKTDPRHIQPASGDRRHAGSDRYGARPSTRFGPPRPPASSAPARYGNEVRYGAVAVPASY